MKLSFENESIYNVFWSLILLFFRENNTKILEYLRDTWTKDRRAEWSIWMVYSKVEMPHHFISGMDDTSNHSAHKRATTSVLKLNDVSYNYSLWYRMQAWPYSSNSFALMQPAQVAATRADLHRRSIAQMRVCLSVFQLHVGFISCKYSFVTTNGCR